MSAANLPDRYDDLAHHYGRSSNAAKAVKYLHLAAQQSASREAYAEAVNQLNHALELLKTQPEEVKRDRIEIALWVDLNFSLKFSGVLGTAATVENLEHANQLCQRIGEELKRFDILEALGDQYCNFADFQKMHALGEEMLGIATRTVRPEFAAGARGILGSSLEFEGNLTAALEHRAGLHAFGGRVTDPGIVPMELGESRSNRQRLCLVGVGFSATRDGKSCGSIDD